MIKLSMILLTSAIILCCDYAKAIPAFARKYDMSCSVCHSPVPSLKPYGDEFAGNGYQLSDAESPRFTSETGDDMLLLMRELPLAIRADGFARFMPDDKTKTDIEWPFIFKILSGGEIMRDVSYFFYFLMNERGGIAGVEDAFLHFNNIGGIELDLTVGQYQVSDPIFKRELRPTFEDYEIYKVKPGASKASLTYDRGVILNYVLPTETGISFSLQNGNGIGEASGGMFDSDPYKNFFLHISQPVDSSFQIGALGYLGRESGDGGINNMHMYGIDAALSAGNIELSGQYLHRQDDNPFFLAGKDSVINSYGGFVQLAYAPELDKSRWYMFLIYNNVRSDIEGLKYHSAAGNFTYILARNLKLTAEYAYYFEQKKNGFTLGFMTAF